MRRTSPEHSLTPTTRSRSAPSCTQDRRRGRSRPRAGCCRRRPAARRPRRPRRRRRRSPGVAGVEERRQHHHAGARVAGVAAARSRQPACWRRRRPGPAPAARGGDDRRQHRLPLVAARLSPPPSCRCPPARGPRRRRGDVGGERLEVDLAALVERGCQGRDDAVEAHAPQPFILAPDALDVVQGLGAATSASPSTTPGRSADARRRGLRPGRGRRSCRRAAAATAAGPSRSRSGRRAKAGPGWRSAPPARGGRGGRRHSSDRAVPGPRRPSSPSRRAAPPPGIRARPFGGRPDDPRFERFAGLQDRERAGIRVVAGGDAAGREPSEPARSRAPAATKEPEPRRVSIRPSTLSAPIASRSEERETSSPRASSRSGGRRSPSRRRPETIPLEPVGHQLIELGLVERLQSAVAEEGDGGDRLGGFCTVGIHW